jgi:predicted NACHT family NTPase
MPLLETIGGVVLKEFAKTAATKAMDSFKIFKPDIKLAQLQESISDHLIFVSEWTKTITFYELVDGKNLDDVTIPLNLTTPRSLKGKAVVTKSFSENDILENNKKYLILGDPGGGKSTTLARLARHVLLSPPRTQNDNSSFPIVVRLRDIENSFIHHLLLCFGLTIDFNKFILAASIKHVARVIRDTKAMLVLDGLDEVPQAIRTQVENDISDLCMLLPETKVVLSCRSGSHKTAFENFTTIELQPLTTDQITIIAGKWLGAKKSRIFLTELHKQKYADSANRPLFLTQLMIVHDRSNCLPYRPYEVPEQLIRLIVVDWDQKNKRKVQRMSDYAGFNTTQKLKFLSALSYELTYEIGLKQFTTPTLVKAYQKICDSFDLPSTQAKDVASEIESHTGLIVRSHGGTYDFCHVSLQEHLCAEYLSRIPVSGELPNYIDTFPGVLALACVLSSNSADWIITLCLTDENWEAFLENPKCMSEFLNRLVIEKPSFGESILFGFAIIQMVHQFWDDCADELYQICELGGRGLIRSCVRALNQYKPKHNPDKNSFNLTFNGAAQKDYKDYELPMEVNIPEEFVSILTEQAENWPEDNQVVYMMSRLM